MSLPEDLRIDLGRFAQTLEASSCIGAGREGGMARLALSDADREMRDLFVTWCREAGLAVRVDELGNIFARRAGRENDLAPVLVGSHLDTQANGGRFDGIVGVLGALELVRRLDDIGYETRRPIEIVNWTNEEGARFSPPMICSGAFAGVYDRDWVRARRADDGPTLGEELQRIGYAGAAPVGGFVPDSCFELHIEQGPILDAEGIDVGIVTHAYDSHGFRVQFSGETAHAGPWPMERRRNALVAAARLCVLVDDIGWDFAESGGKSTTARIAAWPNKTGIVSDWSEVNVDVRHDDPRIAGIMAERIVRAVGQAAARAGCTGEIVERWNWGGAIFDAGLVAGVREQALRLGHATRDLPSQAGHDAYFLARICPTAMIFTPCRDGITHNHREDVALERLRAGLDTLMHAVVARSQA
ncbi:MAG: N-carbamoyl-L-amino-acid hydrolase [Saliniramus fredricksonii]|uniref:N-carbamoyl-L-amino-acid hydrolase n=1 Tax=Saliniramus fredricksonii TaxID=1653334 RepID=A0A0P8BIX4_9HYPH|nr:Zn-dependent hydrolase [Saliniramus fredricksonii]KPQ09243.1 MAG: N-carbamoyl-L-amino-acid hydrolase [Saliniramus fredricksonii]SCC82080.1 N-carbamoyl-L-amino-acid hydrolase [Saliniramus fredricksonii]